MAFLQSFGPHLHLVLALLAGDVQGLQMRVAQCGLQQEGALSDAGFTTDELAKLIHIPPRTYARRVAAHARLKIPEGERAVRVMRLYDTAKQLFGTHDDTRRWLSMELPALGRRTPLDLARTEQGARAVETLIGQIEHGIVT